MTLSEELTWRGLANQTTYPDLKVLDTKPITFYWGVDPSADSMTVGNLAAAMMVRCFIKHGHKPVLLIGGATGLIGDPDGKSKERNLKSTAEIDTNKSAITDQYRRLFGGHNLKIVDNYDWMSSIRYLDFLRDVGKHVPLRQMLARDFVSARLGEQGSGISYAEFSYVLIQAYDFFHLFKNEGVTLQVCGADQWGNSVAGVDLIRRMSGGEAHVYSTPLVVDKTTGNKFGKSEDGAIWLDPKKTTPTAFYQFWINVADTSTENYLKIFTELAKEDIDKLMAEQRADPGTRAAQRQLAMEVTKLVHGEQAAATAKSVTEVLRGRLALDKADNQVLNELRREIPAVKAEDNYELAQVLVDSRLASSKSEARKLISDGAISVNGNKVSKEHLEVSDYINGRLILRRGKAFKDSALVEK